MSKETQIYSRVTEDERKRIEEMAANAGMTLSSFIRTMVQQYANINPIIRTLIDEYAKNLKIEPSKVIETILLDYGARKAATEDVYGNIRDIYNPFVIDRHMRLSQGTELFEFLYERYKRELIMDDREAEKQIEQLRKDRERIKQYAKT